MTYNGTVSQNLAYNAHSWEYCWLQKSKKHHKNTRPEIQLVFFSSDWLNITCKILHETAASFH